MSSESESSSVDLTSNARVTIRGCTINREQLTRIWAVSKQGFPEDSRFRISTDREHGGISSTISGGSIEDVIEGVRRSTLPGDPNSIDNLNLRVANWSEGDRSVAIYITPRGVTVNVEGNDPQWVRGRIETLRDLLRETRPRGFVGSGDTRLFLVSTTAAPSSPLAVFGSAALIDNLTVAFSTALAVIAVAIFCAYLIGRKFDRRARTELRLFPTQVARPTRDWIAIGSLVVAIIGALIAIVAILVAHEDADKQIKKEAFSPFAVESVGNLRGEKV
jgi:hypothetical protein